MSIFLCFAPFCVYAGSLDGTQGKNPIEFSITSGINLSKKTQSTFDSSKTIYGVADKGTDITISVSAKGADGTLKQNFNYAIEVGASGLFSQTVSLGLGENVVEIWASKKDCEGIYESVAVKRKKMAIKTELENAISIPGSTRTSLFSMK